MTKVKDTSLEAYKNLRDSGNLSKGQERVYRVFKDYQPIHFTYKRIVDFTGNPNDQKRINELAALGLIKITGKRDGCYTYKYVHLKAEREKLRQLHATKKPEIERFAAWLHSQRLKQHGDGWYGKVEGKHGEYSHKQLVKAFKQSEKLNSQIIW